MTICIVRSFSSPCRQSSERRQSIATFKVISIFVCHSTLDVSLPTESVGNWFTKDKDAAAVTWSFVTFLEEPRVADVKTVQKIRELRARGKNWMKGPIDIAECSESFPYSSQPAYLETSSTREDAEKLNEMWYEFSLPRYDVMYPAKT
jgi:hypothetical protein